MQKNLSTVFSQASLGLMTLMFILTGVVFAEEQASFGDPFGQTLSAAKQELRRFLPDLKLISVKGTDQSDAPLIGMETCHPWKWTFQFEPQPAERLSASAEVEETPHVTISEDRRVVQCLQGVRYRIENVRPSSGGRVPANLFDAPRMSLDAGAEFAKQQLQGRFGSVRWFAVEISNSLQNPNSVLYAFTGRSNRPDRRLPVTVVIDATHGTLKEILP